MKTILLMYSGGIDSLAALYLLLTDSAYAEYTIHVHHVDIQSIENRYVAERIAVTNTLEWLKDKGFKFVESYSGVGSQLYNNQFLYDGEITNFMAGHICSCCPDIEQVVFGVNKDDIDDPTFADRWRRANLIREVFTPVPSVYVFEYMTKRQVVDLLPPDLAQLSWSCRTPTYRDGHPIPCGQCKTCLALSQLTK